VSTLITFACHDMVAVQVRRAAYHSRFVCAQPLTAFALTIKQRVPMNFIKTLSLTIFFAVAPLSVQAQPSGSVAAD
jgi:hypothetical protein